MVVFSSVFQPSSFFLIFFRCFVLLDDGNYSNREGTIQEPRTLATVKLSGIENGSLETIICSLISHFISVNISIYLHLNIINPPLLLYTFFFLSSLFYIHYNINNTS